MLRTLILAGLTLIATGMHAQPLFEVPLTDHSRWASPENKSGRKGAGGLENAGAKGRPFETIRAGETLELAHVQGPAVLRRIWITIRDRSPEMLRSLKFEIFWDDARQPAVQVPFGDFFGTALGQPVAFEHVLLANPEGRSFVSYIPMPFRKSARLVLTNESGRDLSHVFYDINYTTSTEFSPDTLYFHAAWRRERPTTLGKDFEILPRVTGRGRFVGVNLGVVTEPAYGKTWWGEGEVKIFLDGDSQFPTLVGTGTEDYIGTGWGQGVFTQQYQGCTLADRENGRWAFYRFHIPDPVIFQHDCRVTIQQMGGAPKVEVLKLLTAGAPLRPVTIDSGDRYRFTKLLEKDVEIPLSDPSLPEGWTNFLRRDDVSATVYFYLDRPENSLPPLAAVAERTAGVAVPSTQGQE
ncbi:MAG: glycoside hydrolase family 172 protein [Acidobacteriota bacterium]